MEAWCKTGRVDILAEDYHGNPVIIENHYGCTDGSHFRRLLGYMHDFGSRRAIWIAEEFNAKFIEKVEIAAKSGLDIYLVKAALDDKDHNVRLSLLERFSQEGVSLHLYSSPEFEGKSFYSVADACKNLAKFWMTTDDPISSVYLKNLIDRDSPAGTAINSYLESIKQNKSCHIGSPSHGPIHAGRYWTPFARGNDIAPQRVLSLARLDILKDHEYSCLLKARRSIREGQTVGVFTEKTNEDYTGGTYLQCLCVTPKESISKDALARSYILNNRSLIEFLGGVSKADRLMLARLLSCELYGQHNPSVFESWLTNGIAEDYLFTGVPRNGNVLATDLQQSVIDKLVSYDQLSYHEDELLKSVPDLWPNDRYSEANPVDIENLYQRIKYGQNPLDSLQSKHDELKRLSEKVGGILGLPHYFLPIKTQLDLQLLGGERAAMELFDVISQHRETRWRTLTPIGSQFHSCSRGQDIIKSLALVFECLNLPHLCLAALCYSKILYPLGKRADHKVLSEIIGNIDLSNNLKDAELFGDISEERLISGQFLLLRLSSIISRHQEQRATYSDKYALGKDPKLLISTAKRLVTVDKKSNGHMNSLIRDRYSWMCRNLDVQPFHELIPFLGQEFASIISKTTGIHSQLLGIGHSRAAERLVESIENINL